MDAFTKFFLAAKASLQNRGMDLPTDEEWQTVMALLDRNAYYGLAHWLLALWNELPSDRQKTDFASRLTIMGEILAMNLSNPSQYGSVLMAAHQGLEADVWEKALSISIGAVQYIDAQTHIYQPDMENDQQYMTFLTERYSALAQACLRRQKETDLADFIRQADADAFLSAYLETLEKEVA
jgi:hypothetical protein